MKKSFIFRACRSHWQKDFLMVSITRFCILGQANSLADIRGKKRDVSKREGSFRQTMHILSHFIMMITPFSFIQSSKKGFFKNFAFAMQSLGLENERLLSPEMHKLQRFLDDLICHHQRPKSPYF